MSLLHECSPLSLIEKSNSLSHAGVLLSLQKCNLLSLTHEEQIFETLLLSQSARERVLDEFHRDLTVCALRDFWRGGLHAGQSGCN